MGCRDDGWANWNAEGAGWGGAGAGVDGTKPIWGEVVWGDGVRDGGPAGLTRGGAGGGGGRGGAAGPRGRLRPGVVGGLGGCAGGRGGWHRGGTGVWRRSSGCWWRTDRGGTTAGRCTCCRSDIARLGFRRRGRGGAATRSG